jgi:hypothetical protein
MISQTITFTKWSGPEGMEQHIKVTTGCKPFPSAGINPRIKQKTTILRSVDNTYYYDDDLSDPNNIKYTLFGHNGNQDENEKKFNEPLLNKDSTYLCLSRQTDRKDERIYMVWKI